MSLWRWKKTVLRAMAGELSGPEEARLRDHLGRCQACEGFYEQVSRTEQALLSSASRGAAKEALGARQAAREATRLREALAAQGKVAEAPSARPASSPWSLSWKWGAWKWGAWKWGAMLLPAAALFAFWLRPGQKPLPDATPDTEITWRGGGDRQEDTSPEAVLAYASRKLGSGKHGPIRLVGEMPGSGEMRASVDDYFQLTLRNLATPRFAAAVALGADGSPEGHHVLFPRPGEGPRRLEGTTNGANPIPLGPSIDLASAGLSGHLRLCVFLFERPPEEASFADRLARACAGEATSPLSARVLRGLLIVEK